MRLKFSEMDNALLIAEIRKRADDLGYSKNQYRIKTGGVPATFENVISGRHNPRLLHFLHVVNALGGTVKIEWNDKQT